VIAARRSSGARVLSAGRDFQVLLPRKKKPYHPARRAWPSFPRQPTIVFILQGGPVPKSSTLVTMIDSGVTPSLTLSPIPLCRVLGSFKLSRGMSCPDRLVWVAYSHQGKLRSRIFFVVRVKNDPDRIRDEAKVTTAFAIAWTSSQL